MNQVHAINPIEFNQPMVEISDVELTVVFDFFQWVDREQVQPNDSSGGLLNSYLTDPAARTCPQIQDLLWFGVDWSYDISVAFMDPKHLMHVVEAPNLVCIVWLWVHAVETVLSTI
jgi:hypothetical protein